MWIMFSCLISKIRVLLIFSRVNDFRKNINKSNIKWFTSSRSWICCSSVFTKKTCVVTEICCVLSALTFPDLVWCWWHMIKQIFHAFYSLILKLFALSNIIFNIYLEWIRRGIFPYYHENTKQLKNEVKQKKKYVKRLV